MICILKVVMHQWTNPMQKDIKIFIISKLLGEMLSRIILKISKLLFQVYKISHPMSSNPPYIAAPKVSLHILTLTYIKIHPSALHQIKQLKVTQGVTQMVHLFFEMMAIIKNQLLPMRSFLLFP